MFPFYLEVARASFRRVLVYRWANLAGVLTNAFFGIIICYVYVALFSARPTTNGYDLRDTLRYIWLVQSMIMVVLRFRWEDLMLTIRSGAVISDLSKPCDFYGYWFSREVGSSLYYLFYRGIPTYLAGMLFFGIGIPTDWTIWLAFLSSLTLASALGIAYRFLYNISAFWLLEARAIGGIAGVVAMFFGGSYIPLPLLPPWLQAITAWLPFNGLFNVPAEIFTGKLSGIDLSIELLRQALWVVAFTLLARSITTIAARRVVVQGG